VFSNAALHWMKHPEHVIAGVWRALKPGGRFVGGCGNVIAIITTIESVLSSRGVSVAHTWFFPHPEEYTRLLEARGLSIERMALIPRPTPLPGDMSGWLETFAQPYLSILRTTERRGCISEIVEALRPILCDAQGMWQTDYVRLRFSATKPDIAP
jgi:hypothetical protein